MKHDSHRQNNREEQPRKQQANSSTETELFSKEVIMLTSGLLILTLGIGGVLMFSEDEPLHTNSTKSVNSKQMAKAFHPSAAITLPDHKANEPISSATLVSFKNESESPEMTRSSDEADVYFGFDQADLSDEAKHLIQESLDRFGDDQGWGATIQGHTDQKGSDGYNQALALRRAKSVKDYLITLGAQESSLYLEGLGSRSSICTEDSEECHKQNRRVHIILTKGEPTPAPEAPLVSETAPTESENIVTAKSPAPDSLFSEEKVPTTTALLSHHVKDSESIDTNPSPDPLP